MVKLTSLVVLLLMVFAGISEARGADFFVAVGGNDAWSGKLAAPNAARTDGPFATLERAQRAVREMRQADPGRATPIEVALRGGTYYLEKPLTFTPADSGTANSPTIIRSQEGERAILSGGRLLEGLKAGPDGRWTVHLPQVQSGEWNFIQLFINDQRRYRPRLPRGDYFRIADQLEPTGRFAGRGYDQFKFNPGDIRPDWANRGDVEVLAAQVWTMARLRIDGVNTDQNIVTFTGGTSHKQPWSALKKGNRYLVENVKEALGQPGDWYLDRPTGILTYVPMAGETLQAAKIIAPRIESLLRFEGDPAQRQWVSHVQVRNIDFAHTNWVTPAEGNSFAQAEANVPAAVVLTGARDCAIMGCSVRSIGHYAVDIGVGSKRNRIEDCELADLGAGGLKIGSLGLEKDEEKLTSHTTIRNNLIAHGGRLHPAAIGVWVGQSPYNTIEHNDIADFYYTGVSLGWVWGYRPSGSHHNIVANNRIHHIGQGVLSDMGGIYTLGPSPGTVLKNNLLHDIDAYDYGGWGIYYDEGSTDIVAEHNIVIRAKTGGFHQHYGKENVVRNNIIAFCLKDQVQRTRPEPHISFTFERNIVIFNTGQLLGMNWTGENFKMDRNLYWRTGGQTFDFAKMPFAEWQKKGHDQNSIIADPLFVDAANDDFRLKEGSPAARIGFEAIDISKAGRIGKPPVKDLAPAAFPTRKSQ